MAAENQTAIHFCWPVKVLVFPMARRLGKIRRVADLLERKHGVEAEIYWRTTIKGIAEILGRAGADQPAIMREISEFQEAVQMELRRRAVRWPIAMRMPHQGLPDVSHRMPVLMTEAIGISEKGPEI